MGIELKQARRKLAYHPCCGACPVDPCPAALGRVQAPAPGTVPQHFHVSKPRQRSPIPKYKLTGVYNQATQANLGTDVVYCTAVIAFHKHLSGVTAYSAQIMAPRT